MAEYNSSEAYREIKDLIDRIEWYKSSTTISEVAVQYFIDGGFSKDANKVIEMFSELDTHMLKGGFLPVQWENARLRDAINIRYGPAKQMRKE